ncbi:spore cortex-lytic enzyme [Oceanobacillus alkalisoli]|uniref:spore cortex-lytic enzyme n=1 Tax=Oceanobacillus alkalisoli TaxID=2925113 RepID=UPI001EF0D6D1|nr:spore cortex-lytic enzyme [Oceanobacillus alkalisoli]MCF3941660.1 spore cortex-lytic enzyme [Oceanobacillus alkalisoli]MCG5102941.1 spore cortex-lytic enzyme [Oceanobacillus alkalisoli]
MVVGLFLFPLFFDGKEEVKAFSPQVIQHGAIGDDVIELQARLQYLGFYNGNIDGVFGWGTYWALRNFQYEFGMNIDGLAGEETKNKLVQASEFDEAYVKEQITRGNRFSHYGGMEGEQQQGGEAQQAEQSAPADNTTAVNVPQGFSQNDIQLMANAVYGEARGEPYEGQVAVAAVILNRVASPSFPNTVSGVIFEPRAFTAVADGQIWLTPNERAREAVLDAINGWDPSSNAIYYFNPDTATSPWIWTRPQIKKIGKHIFAK